ncbi:MAG TPA: dTMP kinase [Actinocrinis sp.]|nr:dTMP kinase [Actinocrinis sp.]
MAMNLEAGFFVTLDGPSGVGKTTVSKILADLLKQQGYRVMLTTEPSPSPIGNLARYGTYSYHGLALSLLIAADRYHHGETVIWPALEQGDVVVCDRYIPSSMVLDQLDGVDPEYVQMLYQYLPHPDLAVFLAADPMVCRARAAARGNHTRFQETSPDGNENEFALYQVVAPKLAEQGYPVHVVDIGERTAMEVALAITSEIASHRRVLSQHSYSDPTAEG